MSILVRCECGRYFERPVPDAGRVVPCPACKVGVTVPVPVAPAEPETIFIPDDARPPKVSVKAVASLVLGLLIFYSGFMGLPAIVLGCLALAQIGRSRGHFRGGWIASVGVGLGLLGIYPMYEHGSSPREAARRSQCVNNLKQIGLAFHNYHEVNGCFPPAASVGGDGRPLLSWRVAILPYLEQSELYAKFHLDEPWDSPHNRRLVKKMPSIYSCPSDPDGKPWLTNYRVVVGPKTAFLPDFKPLRIEDFQDGTSNTILVGETQQVVLWTMPEDLPHDGAVARSGLGSHHAKGFNLLFADGSVKFAKEAKYFGAFLDAHLSPNGGEIAYEEPY